MAGLTNTNRIRRCRSTEVDSLCDIINDAAQAYRGVIPEDCWHVPYMPVEALVDEIAAGVEFWGYEEEGALAGVMGFQDKGEVALIRHAYVRTERRGAGIGTQLLHHLEGLTDKPILIGTWSAASWAIRFYAKHGYRVLSRAESTGLLRRYWTISDRQVATSVVLAGAKWAGMGQD